jgi:ribosomal-protein-alanine N-acetyltransferase
MKIREAKVNDLDKIYDIEKRVFSNPWSKQSIKNELNRISLNFISEKNDHLIGYFFSHIFDKEVHILNLAIDIPYQHCGNGKEFFYLIIKKYMEYANVFLEVKKTNFPAINLYLNFGFKEIDRRKMYYSDGQDAIVMSRIVN